MHKLDEKALAAAAKQLQIGRSHVPRRESYEKHAARVVSAYLAAAPSPAPVAVKLVGWQWSIHGIWHHVEVGSLSDIEAYAKGFSAKSGKARPVYALVPADEAGGQT